MQNNSFYFKNFWLYWLWYPVLQIFSPPMHCESKGSPSPEKSGPDQDSKAGCKEKGMDPAFPQLYEQPRHIQYATHFPIPQVRRLLLKSEKITLAVSHQSVMFPYRMSPEEASSSYSSVIHTRCSEENFMWAILLVTTCLLNNSNTDALQKILCYVITSKCCIQKIGYGMFRYRILTNYARRYFTFVIFLSYFACLKKKSKSVLLGLLVAMILHIFFVLVMNLF